MDVHAETINTIEFTFKCPYCRTKYKKNGEPTARSKQVIHRHGSNGDTSNRVEHRIGHCVKESLSVHDFNIHITEQTKRV